ncbi:DMT family transporter [Lactobacillus sp. Marseille-P7033]|nr:DMT family transporter [Lactobacillus sp. Marseille-P7033]NGC77600.1 DMT family transporter [Limosilactobacillus reuteri]
MSAFLYAIYTPIAKILGIQCPPVYLTAYLYLGSAIGLICLYYLFENRFDTGKQSVSLNDLDSLVLMIVLNIGAGILLNLGIKLSSAVSMSLVSNFEIVATAVICGEKITKKLWLGISVIVIASMVLSFNFSSLKISWGIILGLLATILWGFENNVTKKLSIKNPVQVVIIKGFGVGIGSYLIALGVKETPVKSVLTIVYWLILGFFAFGLKRYLGAAQTSAYYALSPFIAVILSLLILGEGLSLQFIIALILMIAGIFIVVNDVPASEKRPTQKYS